LAIVRVDIIGPVMKGFWEIRGTLKMGIDKKEETSLSIKPEFKLTRNKRS
jgi:hypothetical protein